MRTSFAESRRFNVDAQMERVKIRDDVVGQNIDGYRLKPARPRTLASVLTGLQYLFCREKWCCGRLVESRQHLLTYGRY